MLIEMARNWFDTLLFKIYCKYKIEFIIYFFFLKKKKKFNYYV